jgi:N utilization substance protein A
MGVYLLYQCPFQRALFFARISATNQLFITIHTIMMDLKAMNAALSQLEEERGIAKEKIIEAIEQALAAAYKKDYGKRGQIVRAHFDMASGKTEFSQVKIVVDKSQVKMDTGEEEMESAHEVELAPAEGEELIRFNPEHHILLEDARLIKRDAIAGEEITFPLEAKDDYGRIAAQTAKQVIIQRIREAEKFSVLDEYGKKSGDIVTGSVQRIERGTIFIDLGKATGIIPYEEQIPSERYRQGERINAYLYSVEESPRGIRLRLSRSHPKFLEKLFEREVPEVASKTVEIKGVAREPGSRSKIAVMSHDDHIDPVGSCVGQRGVRVSTVMSELGGEKIDIIEWSADPARFIEDALSPARVLEITLNEAEHRASVKVAEDQLSLSIGKEGQNVRLAAKLTGWKIDIHGAAGETVVGEAGEGAVLEETETKERPFSSKEVVEESEPTSEGEAANTLSEEEAENAPSEADLAETSDDDQATTPESTEEAIAEEEEKE